MTRPISWPPSRFVANLGWLFNEFSFDRRFAAAAEAGFRSVEIAAPYHWSPKRLHRRLREADLELALINSPTGPAHSTDALGMACHPDRKGDFRAGFQLALHYAGELGVMLIHVPAGIPPPGLGKRLAIATYVENLAWAVDEAQRIHATVLLEVINQSTAPGFVLGSLAEAAAIIARLDNKPRLLLDIYHCEMSQDSAAHRIRDLISIIGHIQVADVPGRREPGSGRIDWAGIGGAIRSSRYNGRIGCEYSPTNDTLSSLSWMKPIERSHPHRSRHTG
jgi:hydroxypyruvate isomerase